MLQGRLLARGLPFFYLRRPLPATGLQVKKTRQPGPVLGGQNSPRFRYPYEFP
jgi:hypothetical protein